SDAFRRMQLYAKIGDVNLAIYHHDRRRERPEEANQYLIESIANYEKAIEHINQEDQPNSPTSSLAALQEKREEIYKTQKKLADLYLIQGEENAIQWRKYEETAEPFPDFIIYKQQMLQEAQRQQESAERFLNQANSIYDQILSQNDSLSDQDYEEMMYNKAYSHFILRDYPQTLAAGEKLLHSTAAHQLSDSAKTKILYLLGNAAWEQAKENNDYALVKDYYYRALEQDPFYPAEEKGDASHLADIRLINSYYLLGPDKNYPEAIRRFEKMVHRYPESGYAYLTLYYFAKTLEEYGDQLTAEAERLRRDAAVSSNAGNLLAQAQSLEEKARDQYDQAVMQYNKAINARGLSKYIDIQNERYLKFIMFHRGDCAFKKGEYRLAEDYYLQALKRYENDASIEKYKPLAIERLGDLNFRLKNYDQAVKHYKNYLNNSYENKDMRVTIKLADAYLERFSWDQARNGYQKIIQNDPLIPTGAQVDKRTRSGQPSQKGPGFQCLKRIAESHRRQALTLSFEERAAKMNDAVKAYQQMAQKYPLDSQNRDLPDDPDSILAMGQIHLELDNYSQAARCFEKFLELKPDYPRQGLLLYKLGQTYMKLKDFDNAIAKLSQITLEAMDNPAQYADVLILLGQSLQNKANEFLNNSGDEVLYTQYLLRAQRTYNRVSITNQPQKIQEAGAMSAAIDSILRSRAELAAGSAP
ncbi:MAG: tetratricopeptide repeat protein, partial [Candidatus Hinthialibacter sp.]